MAASVVSLFEVKFFTSDISPFSFSLAILPPGCLVSNNKIFQSTGTFFAASRYGSATPVPASIISRGSGWLVRCVHAFLICARILLWFFTSFLLVLESYFLINSSLISGSRSFAQWHVWLCHWHLCICVRLGYISLIC